MCVSHVQSGSLVSLPSVPVAETLLASSQSFSACPESWYRTYVNWLSGGLSRRCLLEVVSSEDAGRYLAARETCNLDNCLSDRLQTRVCSQPLPAVTPPSLLPCQPLSSLLPPEDVLDECSVGVEKPCFSAGSRHLEFRVEDCAEYGRSKNPRQSQPVSSTDGGSSKSARQCQPDRLLVGGSSRSARQSQPVFSTDVGTSINARQCQPVALLDGVCSKVACQSQPVSSTDGGSSKVARQSLPVSSTDGGSSKVARQSLPVSSTDGGSSKVARQSLPVSSTDDGSSKVARQSQPVSSTDGGSSRNPRQSQPVSLTDRGSSENSPFSLNAHPR